MKITMDLPALERLIGGNTEMEVELRNCILETFARKHIKAVANNQMIAKLTKQVNDFIADNMASIGKEENAYWTAPKVSITPRIKEEIKKQFQEQIGTMFSENIEAMRLRVLERIESYEKEFNRLVDEKIDKDLNKIVNERVAAKLAAIAKGIA